MINGLDLFSGIGGISLALAPWVRTIAYCETDRYARAVLLSRMQNGELHNAPIWSDVRTLRGFHLSHCSVDIIFGGFPCQDISTAGTGAGLEGSRSGLFFEISRLTRELRPRFVFLENVPAIAVRGLDRVLLEFTAMGYDTRWTTVSAASIGAPHKRDRWFLLAHSNCELVRNEQQRDSGRSERVQDQGEVEPGHNGEKKPLANTESTGLQISGQKSKSTSQYGSEQCGEVMADSSSERRREERKFRREQSSERIACGGETMADPKGFGSQPGRLAIGKKQRDSVSHECGEHFRGDVWWSTEPDVGRVVNGLPNRVDRVKGLGNAVVPLQARKAFELLLTGGRQ